MSLSRLVFRILQIASALCFIGHGADGYQSGRGGHTVAHADKTGLSRIATANNAADTYAAIDACPFYQLSRLSGDESTIASSM